MDNTVYYSAERRGFFPVSDRETYEQSLLGWPSDAVEITEEYKEELFKKQADGYEIVGDDKGYPIAVLNEPSAEELAEGTRATLLSEADSVIQPMLGYAMAGLLSEEEKEEFKRWNAYRKAVQELDVSVDNLVWPERP